MSKRQDDGDVPLKVFRDGPGRHFNPYFNSRKKDRQAHERGEERKAREAMGERRKIREASIHEIQAVSVRKVPVTLAPLKWGGDK